MIKFIFITLFVITLLTLAYLKNKKNHKKLYIIPTYIKDTYKKINVSADKIVIKTNGYYEANDENGNSKIGALDSIGGKYNDVRDFKEVSVLVYNDYKIMGRFSQLKSQAISIPSNLLKQKLKENLTIDIYFHEKDSSLCFYDLSFLI